MAYHDKFDLAFFADMFPLEKLRAEARVKAEASVQELIAEWNVTSAEAIKAETDEMTQLFSPEGEQITSPFDIAVVELLRREALDGQERPSVPTDLFIFNRGEAPTGRGYVTKVGGVPWQQNGLSWPKTRDGRNYVFAGQLCFADSRDLVGDSMAEKVLLVFFDEYDFSDKRYGIHLEWSPLSLNDPMAQSDVPSAEEVVIEPCYGSIYRTIDFIEPVPAFEKYESPWLLSALEGTKIGGVPRFIQDEETPDYNFLCSIGSVQPASDVPYPWLNDPTPIPLSEMHDKDYLMWADLGCLYILTHKRIDKTDWIVQSY